MVGSDEKVIFVTATPHTAQSMPTLKFSLEEEGATAGQNSVAVITQVGTTQTQHCSTLLLSLYKSPVYSVGKIYFRHMGRGETWFCCIMIFFLDISVILLMKILVNL